MDESIEKLKNSLIYKMSLGSKELYHSNVWAWLIENDSNFIDAFVEKIPSDFKLLKVVREEKNRDLTLHFLNKENNEKCIVIENKLKSIPYIEQLEKYTNDLRGNFYEGILTGIILPNIFNGDKSINLGDNKIWCFSSYSEISRKILDILNKSINTTIINNKLLIEEYCNNIIVMEQIVSNAIISNNLYVRWDNDLDDLGLLDLVKKVNGSLFINYVKLRLDEDKINHKSLQLGQSFHNKKITIDIRLERHGDWFYCGTQIEGNQFRRIIDKKTTSLDDLFNMFVGYGFFDGNYNPKIKEINLPNFSFSNAKTSMSKKYDKYGDSVVYQYVNIEDFDFEALYQLIKNDLKLSIGIFDKVNN